MISIREKYLIVSNESARIGFYEADKSRAIPTNDITMSIIYLWKNKYIYIYTTKYVRSVNLLPSLDDRCE